MIASCSVIPSQATIKNSSSWLISCISTSGKAVTICCSGGRSALFLNSKSPIARDRARLPLTRPKSTKPPAALIRAFSPIIGEQIRKGRRNQNSSHGPSFCGLWSNERGFARPLTPNTERESPALPYTESSVRISSHQWSCQG